MNYKIIQDKDLLLSFIEWLPELLLPNEKYYVTLLARRKYDENSTISHKAQLKRFTSDKKYLYQKIKQLEIELGSYKDKEQDIKQNVLALYISINPRDLRLATKKTLKVLLDKVLDDNSIYNPHSEVLNQIQISCTNKYFYDFDFDNVDYKDVLEQLKNKINFDCLKILKTRSGFHLLVNINKIEKQFKKSWHQTISKLEGVDVKGDNLVPIPGTVQGGFTPHFIEI